MLPNRICLTKVVEEQLKQLKIKTSIAPNVSARIAFFRSIESTHRYVPKDTYKLDGSLLMDKYTWLGNTQLVTELILKHKYPNLEGKELQAAWAFHVEHGTSTIRNHKQLTGLVHAVTDAFPS